MAKVLYAVDKKAKAKKTTIKKAKETTVPYGKQLSIGYSRACNCPPNNINCMTAKEWLKSQIGVWQFFYENG